MTKHDKLCLSFLTGVIPPEFQGEDFTPPTPGEIKAFLLKLPRERHRRIVGGPNGKQFQSNATKALREFAEAEQAQKAKNRR